MDLRQPLEDLRITFQGEDLEQSNQNLRIFTIRVSNDGAVDILQDMYDQSDTWGLRFNGGKVVEARTADGSSGYLQDGIEPRLIGVNIVELAKLILEPGEFFTVEVLVLHDKVAFPDVEALGKVAGIDRITPEPARVDGPTDSLVTQALGGHIGIQMIRIVTYLAVVILAAVSIGSAATIGQKATNAIGRRRRAKRIQIVLETMSLTEEEWVPQLASLYTEGDIGGLKQLQSYLEDTDRLLGAMSVALSPRGGFQNIPFIQIDDTLRQLFSTGNITSKGELYEVDRSTLRVIDTLVEILDN